MPSVAGVLDAKLLSWCFSSSGDSSTTCLPQQPAAAADRSTTSSRCLASSRQETTKIRSCQMIGEACPVPGTATFQAMFSVAAPAQRNRRLVARAVAARAAPGRPVFGHRGTRAAQQNDGINKQFRIEIMRDTRREGESGGFKGGGPHSSSRPILAIGSVAMQPHGPRDLHPFHPCPHVFVSARGHVNRHVAATRCRPARPPSPG